MEMDQWMQWDGVNDILHTASHMGHTVIDKRRSTIGEQINIQTKCDMLLQ